MASPSPDGVAHVMSEIPRTMKNKHNQRMEFFDTPHKRTLITSKLDVTAIGISHVRHDAGDVVSVSPPDIEDAFVAHVHLKPQIAHISIDNRAPTPFNTPENRLNILDFRRRLGGYVSGPFEFVSFHIPFPAFDMLAPGSRAQVITDLTLSALDHVEDHETMALAMALLPSFHHSRKINRLFVDHMGLALVAHIGQRYGRFDILPSVAGYLEPWQERIAKELMDAHLQDGLHLSELADACGLPLSYFSRAFRKTCGMPPYQWLQHRRIEVAKALLRTRNMTLVEIASECGFSDQSHLSRTFRRLVGMSPGAWRSLNRVS